MALSSPIPAAVDAAGWPLAKARGECLLIPAEAPWATRDLMT
jgi:hypothetical protein